MTVQRFDVVPIRARRTDEGYIEDTPVLTRTGIFSYRDPATGRERREYRPAEEVFHADSLASYRGKPIAVGHGPGMLHSKNVRAHGAGTVLSAGRQDGDNVVADVMIHDTAAVDAGQRELSMGYQIKLDETPGVTAAGEPYDAVQRDIRINHCALVKAGRAGNARLNLDEADPEIMQEPSTMPDVTLADVRLDSGITYKAAPEVAHALEKLRTDLAAAVTRADTAQAAADTHKAALDTAVAKHAADAERLRADGVAQARARLDLEAQATALKVEFKADMSDQDIRAAVVRKVRGDALDLTGKSPDYVAAAYDLAISEAGKRTDALGEQRRSMAGGNGGGQRADTAKADPYEAHKQWLANAWRGDAAKKETV
jgi:uncharacterized protein